MSAEYTSYKEITPKGKGYYIYLKCQKDNMDVVLKALKEQYRDKKRYQDALTKEYDTVSKMDNAGIVRYTDLVETTEYGLAIEMELVEARTLKEYIQEKHSEEEKMAIVEQLAGILQYVHNMKVVHGAINSQNVLITTANNHVKICNFRTITSFEQDDFEAMKYVAPEQKDNGSVAIDHRADIYSLGAIMKALGFWPEYEAAIKKCMALGRYDRYESCDEFLADIQQDDSGIHIDTKWIVAVVAAAAVATIIYFVATSGVLSNIHLPSFSSEDDTAVADTVASSQIDPDHKPSAENDTVKMQVPQTEGDALSQEVKHALDSVFAPYLEKKDAGLNNSERKGLRMQTKAVYRQLTGKYADATAEERQQLDETFSSYAKELKAQFPDGVEPHYERKAAPQAAAHDVATETAE